MITKDMIIGEVLDNAKNPEAVAKLLIETFDMHCITCPCARGESIADAASVHGLDVDAVVKALNEVDK